MAVLFVVHIFCTFSFCFEPDPAIFEIYTFNLCLDRDCVIPKQFCFFAGSDLCLLAFLPSYFHLYVHSDVAQIKEGQIIPKHGHLVSIRVIQMQVNILTFYFHKYRIGLYVLQQALLCSFSTMNQFLPQYFKKIYFKNFIFKKFIFKIHMTKFNFLLLIFYCYMNFHVMYYSFKKLQ